MQTYSAAARLNKVCVFLVFIQRPDGQIEMHALSFSQKCLIQLKGQRPKLKGNAENPIAVFFSTFKQDKVKLANPIFKRTRQAAAKVKIEREKKIQKYTCFFVI